MELATPKELPSEIKEERKIIGSHENWYKNANNYWNNVSRDDHGMLQGWEIVSEPDIKCSDNFLTEYIKSGIIEPKNAIDCGGGIGRISKNLLVKHFENVDIVDQAPNLIETAKNTIKDPHMRNFYVSGLQNFVFPEKYNCIWIQWTLMHIPDDDAVKILKNCKANLADKVELNKKSRE